MRCERVMDHLDDWLDEALDARLRSAVDAHLAGCESCRREFARHRALADDLAVLGRIADRIVDAPVQRPLRRVRWTRIGKVAVVLAIAIGAALAGWSQMNPRAPRRVVEFEPIVPNGVPTSDEKMVPTRFEYEPAEPSRHMVVAIKSDNPRIHIVWLYENTLGKQALPDADGAKPDLHEL
ncbi:MAG: zf-HC2 domain-containing protein [Planctomycetota bacterium]|nr:zf-HC2 domain-containing protein [Planctomycetota bacterium]